MAEKNKQLITRLNVGTQDQPRLGIPNSPQGEFPPVEGDVIEVPESQAASIMAQTSAFEPHDPEVEARRLERVKREDQDRLRPQVEAKLAMDEVVKEAEASAKKGTSTNLPRSAAHVEPHQTEAEKKK